MKRFAAILALLACFACTACGGEARANFTRTIPEGGVVAASEFSSFAGKDVIGIFESADGSYQWSFYGKQITEPKDADLSLSLSSDRGDNYAHLFGDYVAFELGEGYPGTPSLRIKLPGGWTDEAGNPSRAAYLYRFDGQEAVYLKYGMIGDDSVNFSVGNLPAGTVVASAVKPEGLPDPVDENYRDPDKTPDDNSLNPVVTISIACHTARDNWDKLKPDAKYDEIVPPDGVILAETAYYIRKGDTVFDVLYAVTKELGIQMESRNTPLYNSRYIVSINNLREFDCGGLSGWMYCVNGWYPNYGVSRYKLKNGDKIEFNYTCDLGNDLGQPVV